MGLVVDVFDDAFTVTLIPETLSSTTLGDLSPGDAVNIETDILVKTIVRTVERKGRREKGAPGGKGLPS